MQAKTHLSKEKQGKRSSNKAHVLILITYGYANAFV